MAKPDRKKENAPGRKAKGVQVSRAGFPAQSPDDGNGSQHHHTAQLLVGVSRSTSSEAQRARIVAALRTGPKTSYDLRRLGCYQAPARIKELRDKFGYTISTQRVTLWDRDGWPHRGAALYTLLAEPVMSLTVVAQTIAAKAMAGAQDHRDGFQRAKAALGRLQDALAVLDGPDVAVLGGGQHG